MQTLPGSLKNGYDPYQPAIDGENHKNIIYEETQTGSSSGTAEVTTYFDHAGMRSNLYLAAISTPSNVPVAFVMGLGLSWTRIAVQNSARGQSGLEVWMAQGAPVSSGNVTAFFDGIAENSVIAVSRYSGVDPRNPIGSIVAGNPLRVNGGSAGEINENYFSFDDRAASPAMGSASQNYSATPHSDYEDWVEISEDTFGSVTSLAVQDQPIPSASSIPLNGVHGDGVDWAVIGVEIKPGTPEYRFERIFTGGIEGISIDPTDGIYPGFTQASLKALSPAGMNL